MSGTFSYVASEELGKQLCEVFELNASQVQSMRIELNVAGPVLITVKMLMPDDNGKFVSIMRKYRLVDA